MGPWALQVTKRRSGVRGIREVGAGNLSRQPPTKCKPAHQRRLTQQRSTARQRPTRGTHGRPLGATMHFHCVHDFCGEKVHSDDRCLCDVHSQFRFGCTKSEPPQVAPPADNTVQYNVQASSQGAHMRHSFLQMTIAHAWAMSGLPQ